MKLGVVKKDSSIIGNSDNYDLLNHESVNVQTQIEVASTCKACPLFGGGQTACCTQTYFKKLH